MFPVEKIEENCQKSKEMIIYRGQKVSFGVLLTVDKNWKYELQADETLTVEIRNVDNEAVITKKFTKSDVDKKDKIISVTLSEEETKTLEKGRNYICLSVNGYIAMKPRPVIVKDVVDDERCEML